jgi:hypothetical protein
MDAIKSLRCECGELHPSALTLKAGRFICGNCLGLQRRLRQGTCTNCKAVAPLHTHHKDGRAVSDDTEDWCVNCHQKLHRGRELRGAR